MTWREDRTCLLVACPACGRGVGEVCIVGYSFAVDPHEERLEAARQLDPLICRNCGQQCEERDFDWVMQGTAPRRRRRFFRRKEEVEEVLRQDICGYCTNWGVF